MNTKVGFIVITTLLFRLANGWSVQQDSTTSTSRGNYHVTRRQLFIETLLGSACSSAAILGISAVALGNPSSALAASSGTPSTSELTKLQKGHARVAYLLENWDAITSVCGKGVMSDTERRQVIRTEGGGGGSCEKTPLRVQEFLGYKSTEDPLFRADKLMFRAAPMVDDVEVYLDAVEKYREKADQGAMMAYTSSWGEANPNGGKEVVDEYLERTRLDVEETEKLLRNILTYLDLEVLPPSA